MFIYIHLFYCTIKTSKWPWTLLKGQRYSTASHKFQISLHFSLQTPVFELQAILRQGHQMTPKWPWTRRVQRHQYKIWVHLHTGRFKKIAISYPGMIFSHWQKFQKLYIHSLSTTPPPRNWAYFCSTGSGFWDMDWFSNCHIWVWNLFTNKTSRNCTYTLFLPQGVEIGFIIFALWAVVSEIWDDFKNCYIWAWNMAIGQSFRSCTYTLLLPQRLKLSLYLL